MSAQGSIRRKLYMHPAHTAIGVSGGGGAGAPYCRITGLSADAFAEPALRVSLAAHRPDADIRAAMSLFHRVLDQQDAVRCDRVELDTLDFSAESLANTDCLVVFGRRLQIVGRLSNLESTDFTVVEPGRPDGRAVEVKPAVQGHPILEGVKAFVADIPSTAGYYVPADAMFLLTGFSASWVKPVAWVRNLQYVRGVDTAFGSSHDFRQPEFARFMLNAIAWVAEPRIG